MEQYRSKKTSVFWSLIGILLLVSDFGVFVALRFSKSAENIGGYSVVYPEELKLPRLNNKRAALIADIKADDFQFMPDDSAAVVKGLLIFKAVWSDGYEQILVNYRTSSQFIRADFGRVSYPLRISTENIMCKTDTLAHRKISYEIFGHLATVKYAGYKFNISLRNGKVPDFVLKREVLPLDEKVVLYINKVKGIENDNSISVSKTMPYRMAKNQNPVISFSDILLIIVLIVGLSLFFIPEKIMKNGITI